LVGLPEAFITGLLTVRALCSSFREDSAELARFRKLGTRDHRGRQGTFALLWECISQHIFLKA
jgi:hypothetical protein